MKNITRYNGVFALFVFILASIPFGAFSREGDRLEVEDRQPRTERGSVEEFVSDELIVKYKGDSEPFRVEKLSAGRSPKDAAREFGARPDVEYAEPNYLAYASMVPSDPYYSYQWHVKQIGMESAWDVSNASGTVVAVVDTGIAYETYRNSKTKKSYYKAPDLGTTCFKQGYDYVENDTHPNDDNSHGTHVAGTVAQSTNNGIGVAGVAFGSCVMPVKVLDRNGAGTYANIAKGIRFAADNGAKVINLSLGGPSSSQTLLDAIAYAYNIKGVTIIGAAGNDGTNVVSYPAAYDSYVIAVGATRYDQTLAPYSNFGTSVDVVAPGGDTSVDQNGDGYGDGVLQNTFNPYTKKTSEFGYWFFQGTSMAAPHVAGLAALVISKGNASSTADVRNAIESTTKDLGVSGKDTTYGWGLIDAPAALSWTPGP